MTQYDLARTAYGAGATPVRTPRGMEYEAFARVTRRLRAAGAKDGGFADLVRALHENRRLWTMVALLVSDPANRLPPDLRAKLFYLAEYSLQETTRVLRHKADIAVLIDVNTAIMRGLGQSGPER